MSFLSLNGDWFFNMEFVVFGLVGYTFQFPYREMFCDFRSGIGVLALAIQVNNSVALPKILAMAGG